MRRATLFAAVAVMPLCGCGTVCNFVGGVTNPQEEPRVYGGVKRDAEVLANVGPIHLSPGTNAKGLLFIVPVLAAEPLLSFAGDTLTLPITLYFQERREAAMEAEHAALAPPPVVDTVVFGQPSPLVVPAPPATTPN